MNTYPATEQTIWDVERGRTCQAVFPRPFGDDPAVGEAVLIAHASNPAGREPSFVKGGDSVVVSLTEVSSLDRADPASGRPLVRLSWKPLGQVVAAPAPKRVAKAR